MRKVVYIQILQVVTLFVGILITPYYFRHISSEQYGFAILFSQIVVYLGIFDFGLSTFLVQRISVVLIKAGLPGQHRVISKSFGILLIMLLILIPPSVLLAANIDRLFDFSFELTLQTKALLLLCFITTLGTLFFKPLVSILVAREHLLFNSISATCSTLIYAIGSLLLLRLGYGVDSFLYAYLAGAIISTGMNYFFLKTTSGFAISIERPQRSDLRDILTPSFLIFVNGLAAQIIYNGDRIILAKFVGVSVLTAFALNIRVIEIAQNLLIKLADLYIPKIVKQVNTTAERSLAYYQVFTKAITVVTVLAIANVVALNQAFVHLWVGSDFLLGDFTIILLYLCVMFSHVIFRIPSLFLYGMNLNKGYTTVSLIDAAINIVLSILLAQDYGIKGVVTATLVATLFTSAPMNIYFLRQAFAGGVSIKSILAPVVVPFIVSSPVLIFTYYAREVVFDRIQSWTDFVIFAALGNLVFITSLMFLNYRGYSNLRLTASELNHAIHR